MHPIRKIDIARVRRHKYKKIEHCLQIQLQDSAIESQSFFMIKKQNADTFDNLVRGNTQDMICDSLIGFNISFF